MVTISQYASHNAARMTAKQMNPNHDNVAFSDPSGQDAMAGHFSGSMLPCLQKCPPGQIYTSVGVGQ
jgi:hypothetical protein